MIFVYPPLLLDAVLVAFFSSRVAGTCTRLRDLVEALYPSEVAARKAQLKEQQDREVRVQEEFPGRLVAFSMRAYMW